jgi:parallel beta-helix repeat protein
MRGIVYLINSMPNMIIICLILFSSTSIAFSKNNDDYDFESDEGTGWFNCGNCASWHLDSDEAHRGSQSFKSGDIGCTGTSRLCRDIRGPATVEFWWKTVPVPEKGSQLSFIVDGRTERTWAFSSWKKEPIVNLEENREYKLVWELNKLRCPVGTRAVAWIDDVFIKYYSSDNEEGANQTVYVRQYSDFNREYEYASINEALKHVANGGVVLVSKGRYNESLNIKFPVSLIGESASDSTIIYADGGNVINISSHDVKIQNLSLKGSSIRMGYGIRVVGSDCKLIGNNINNCLDGIVIKGSNNVKIEYNNLSNISRVGIWLVNDSSDCKITNNDILGTEQGICLWNVFSNRIYGNKIVNSRDGISLRIYCHDNTIGMDNKFLNIMKCDINNTSRGINVMPDGCSGRNCMSCTNGKQGQKLINVVT